MEADTLGTIIGNIIVAFVSGVLALLGSLIINNRKLTEKDIEHAKQMQAILDRLGVLEKSQKGYDILLEKMNGMENSIIKISTDLEYLKEKNK